MIALTTWHVYVHCVSVYYHMPVCLVILIYMTFQVKMSGGIFSTYPSLIFLTYSISFSLRMPYPQLFNPVLYITMLHFVAVLNP